MVNPEQPKQSKPDEVEPISKEELTEAFTELRERAKDAGVRPVQMMISSYITQAFSAVNGLLEALDGKKKQTEPTPTPEPEPRPDTVATAEPEKVEDVETEREVV